MLNMFPKSVSVGAKFGTVIALVEDEEGETQEVEVTTFRSEEEYTDGRWPTNVQFVDKVEKDLGRRDFTINAMAIDLTKNDLNVTEEQEWDIYDPFNGLADIQAKKIRAVGTPIERFKEDGLRVIRACRFASILGFEIEEETFKAAKQAIPVVRQVSMERIKDEFMKMLLSSPKPSVGIEMMREIGVLEIFLPELLEGYGVEQKLFHSHDVYYHNLYTCDKAEDSVKLVALLHDIGKPRADTKDGHFYGHDIIGTEMLEAIMRRLRFSNSEIEKACTLVKNHMFYYPYPKENMTPEEIENIEIHSWSDSAVRRFIQRVGEENIEDLFRLRIADASSNPHTAFDPEEINILQKRISEVRQQDMALKISDLVINGNDLEAIGIEKGPQMGKILNDLLDMVVEDPLLNTKEKLLEEAKKLSS